MPYYNREQLESMGFKEVGENVKVSDRASIYDCHDIEIGDNSRIDDFCVISGRVSIGKNVHITPQCLIAGGEEGVFFEDFTTAAYGVKVFSQTDDYSGETMTNSTVPKQFKSEVFARVVIGRYSIIGANSTILPGIKIAEGTSIGAMSLIIKNTQPWGIYAGVPAKRIKERSKSLLKLVDKYLH